MKNAWLSLHLRVLPLALLLATVVTAPASASSFLAGGRLANPELSDGKKVDRAHCLFFSGPHGTFLGPGEFLIRLLDNDDGTVIAFDIAGTYTVDAKGRYRLFPDRAAAQADLQRLVDEQLGSGLLQVALHNIKTVVTSRARYGDEIIKCEVLLHAALLQPGGKPRNSASVRFNGLGRHFTEFHGPPAPPSLAVSTQNTCPIPNLTADTQFCGTPDCLLTFSGFRWWTNYQYRGAPDYYFNNGQAWSPRNAFVDGEGLHLTIRKDDLGGGSVWAASEVVAMFLDDGVTPAPLGYGRYLVAARVKSAASFDQLDLNVAFGAFTYQKDKSGDANNPYRELDMAEISRWGHQPGTPCTDVLDNDPRLCRDNAQFTLQTWNAHPDNLQRFSIGAGVNEVTLVMNWPGANQPVTFQQYDGLFTLDTLPASPTHAWTSTSGQQAFVPVNDCQRFHLNLWMGNFSRGTVHPGPTNDQPQEVVVTRFQYAP